MGAEEISWEPFSRSFSEQCSGIFQRTPKSLNEVSIHSETSDEKSHRDYVHKALNHREKKKNIKKNRS